MTRLPGRRIRGLALAGAAFLVLAAVGIGAVLYVRSDPETSRRRRLVAARAAMTDGRFDSAAVLLARLADEEPERADLRTELAICLMRTGHGPEAAAAARAAIALAPDLAPAHAVLAWAARAAGRMDQAVAEGRLATKGRQVAPDAGYDLALLLIDAGLTTEGTRLLTEAVAHGEGGHEAALRLALLTGGERGGAEPGGRATLDSVLNALDGRLAARPGDGELLVRYSRLALAAGRPGLVRKAMERARGLRPLTPAEKLMLARAAPTGPEARAALEELPAKAGDPAEAARAWIEAGRPERAVPLLDSAIAGAPERSGPLLGLRLEAVLARTDLAPRARTLAALKAATALLAARPLDERGREVRAALLLDLGRPSEALRDADTLRRSAPANPAGAWYAGRALLALGYPAGALPLLRAGRKAPRATDVDRTIARAAVEAADAGGVRDELPRLVRPGDTAIRAAATAVAGDPAAGEKLAGGPAFDGSPLDDRIRAAAVLAAAGRPGTARRLVETLAPVAVDDHVLLRIGELDALLGDRDAARSAWNRAAKSGGPGAVPALVRLGRLRMDAAGGGTEEIVTRLLGLSGGRIPGLILRGRAALRRGEAEAARRAAEEVLASVPDQPDALILSLGAGIVAKSPPATLLDAAERVLAVAPGHAAARIVRARCLYLRGRAALGRGDEDAALSDFTAAAGAAPGPAEALVPKGLLECRVGDPEQAERDAELLAASPGGAAPGAYVLGMVRLAQGRPDDAARAFARSAAAAPDSADPLPPLVRVLLLLGRAGEAEKAAARWAKLAPDSDEPVRWLAAAEIRGGRPGPAADRLEAAARRSPDDAGLAVDLARARLAAGRTEKAIAGLRELTGSRPRFLPGHRLLVAALLVAGRSGDAATAARAAGEAGLALAGRLLTAYVKGAGGDARGEISELRAAVARFPDSADARALLGERLLAAGDLDGAAEQLAAAAKLAPGRARVLTALGVVEEMRGRIEQAVGRYESALAANPFDPMALNNLAFRYAANPRTAAKAADLATRAVELAPESADFRDTLALALRSTGRLEEASAAAEEAVRLAPGRALIRTRAAETWFAAGDRTRAREAGSRALALATPAERAEVVRRLRAILPDLVGR